MPIVQKWLQEQDLTDKQRLAESLQVSPGWEVAVEAVLGNYLQAVCVDNIDAIASKLNALSTRTN